MTKDDFIVFGQPLIEQAEIDEVTKVLKAAWLGTGPRCHEFEEKFANYKNVEFSTALNSCTAGLHLSCLVLGLKPGDEVITSAMTFCATVNAIIHSGATPVLADIDPDTWNLNPEEVEKKISKKTKAIIPVHFAGRSCEMDKLVELAKNENIKIIEDCAHAIESTYKGKPVGTFGDVGVFSFYATKNIVTGEGGMAISSDELIINKIRKLALHGLSTDAWARFSDKGYNHYLVEDAGFKCNMMDLQAAIGLHQLDKIEQLWKKRKKIWSIYDEAFINLPITLPAPWEKGNRHGHHLYTILIDEKKTGIVRDEFMQAMYEKGIGTGVHYLSIPEHHYYQKKYGWHPEDYPKAMRVGRQTVSLPLSAKLEENDVGRIIHAVCEIFQDD